MTYQPKTGRPCMCKAGLERDNCPRCEGTGQEIDFAAICAQRDPTEAARRLLIEIGAPEQNLAATTEQKWTMAELARDFEVIGFAAPFVVARKRDTGEKGTLEFTHSPRVYFNWRAD